MVSGGSDAVALVWKNEGLQRSSSRQAALSPLRQNAKKQFWHDTDTFQRELSDLERRRKTLLLVAADTAEQYLFIASKVTKLLYIPFHFYLFFLDPLDPQGLQYFQASRSLLPSTNSSTPSLPSAVRNISISISS